MEAPLWTDRNLSHFFSSTGDDIFDIHKHFADWRKEAHPGGYYLYDQAAKSAPSVNIRLTNQNASDPSLLNLASYNYLGLAQRAEVIEAAVSSLQHYGLGAAGSPRLSGQLSVHNELADTLADFKELAAVLLYPSGYSANIGVISALAKHGDYVITDQYAHASIFDGVAMSGAKLMMFRHNNMHSLEDRLKRAKGRTLVIAEGVYSMDGDVAPLPEIAELCQRYKARLMVDEAHSAFVYGEHGRGLVEHFGIEDAVDVHFGTLSKSLGGIGGYVGGSQELINYLFAYSRSQIFSCALSPAIAGGVLAALNIVKREPHLRTKLWNNVEVMRSSLLRNGIDIGASTSQIIPVMINDDVSIFTIVKELMNAGIYLNPVVYPAVSVKRSRLRVSVSAAHDPAELEQSAEIIAHVLRRHHIIL